MIPYTAKYKDYAIDFEIPAGWHEVTLRQLVRIATDEAGPDNQLAFVASMIGQETKEIMNWPADLVSGIFTKLADTLSEGFPVWEKLPKPTRIDWQGKQVQVPESAGDCPAGAVTTMVELIRRQGGKAELMLAAPCVAHMMYDRLTGDKWDEQRAAAIVEQIEAMPAKVVLPLAYFFLRQLKARIENGPSDYTGSAKRKSTRRGLKSWISSGV